MIWRQFILVFLIINSLWAGSSPRHSAEKPNIIIIFSDDQGYQDLGCYGSPDIKTPNIDQLAHEGIRFTDFYVAANVCTPSRAGLLTGRYPVRMGLASGVLFPHSGKKGLPQSEQTIAELIRSKGYKSACIGKWHLGHTIDYLPQAHGFDLFYGIPYSNDMWLAPELRFSKNVVLHESLTMEKIEDLRRLSHYAWDVTNAPYMDWIPLMLDEEVVEFPVDQSTLTKKLTDQAIKFIESNKDDPFLLYLAHPMPHIPLFASQRFNGHSAAGLYGDVIEELDYETGRLISVLDKLDISKNTLVIFTSDNGPWLSKGADGGHALPLRSGKGSVFEGGMRVPCIMRWPGIIPSNVMCSDIASTLDIFPTIANFLDIDPINKVDGFPLQNIFSGLKKSDVSYYLYYGVQGRPAAIRVDDWKLIFDIPVGGAGEKKEKEKYVSSEFKYELYNLNSDIGEQVNVIDRFPKRASQMKIRASEIITRINSYD